jgi:hypothetical protein
MTAIKDLLDSANSLKLITENKNLIAISISSAKCHQEVAMSYHEVTNQLEQEYYNKASGCSVKAQKDNLFDYKFWVKK